MSVHRYMNVHMRVIPVDVLGDVDGALESSMFVTVDRQSKKKPSQNGTNKSFMKQSVKTCDHNVFTAKKYSEIQWTDVFQSANQQNNE